MTTKYSDEFKEEAMALEREREAGGIDESDLQLSAAETAVGSAGSGAWGYGDSESSTAARE